MGGYPTEFLLVGTGGKIKGHPPPAGFWGPIWSLGFPSRGPNLLNPQKKKTWNKQKIFFLGGQRARRPLMFSGKTKRFLPPPRGGEFQSKKGLEFLRGGRGAPWGIFSGDKKKTFRAWKIPQGGGGGIGKLGKGGGQKSTTPGAFPVGTDFRRSKKKGSCRGPGRRPG